MATRKKSSSKETEFEEAVSSAARSLGWLLPQTEEEVAESELALDATEAPAPAVHFDPLEALDREATFSQRPSKVAETQPEYEAELRRAARSGTGPVPEDVEERMRRDRRKAEQEKDRE